MVAPLIRVAAAALEVSSAIRNRVAIAGVKILLRKFNKRAATDIGGLQQRLSESLKRSGLMPEVSMKVDGVKECVDMLKRMDEATRNRIVRRAASAAAKVMAAQVKATTYDDNSRKRRTGLMGSAIRTATKVEGNTVKAFVTERKRGRPSPFYWWFLERGTATRTTRKGASRGAIFPRPWVAPAAGATQARALAKFASVLKSGVEREAAKSGR